MHPYVRRGIMSTNSIQTMDSMWDEFLGATRYLLSFVFGSLDRGCVVVNLANISEAACKTTTTMIGEENRRTCKQTSETCVL